MMKLYFHSEKELINNIGKIIPYELTQKYSSIKSSDDLNKVVILKKFSELEDYLLKDIKDDLIKNIIVFHDSETIKNNFDKIKQLRQVVFIHELYNYFDDKNKLNINMSKKQIAEGIKKLIYLNGLFDDQMTLPIMRMPRKNFQSKILKDLYDEIETSFNTNNIEKFLADFAQEHKKPKRRTTNKKIKFFEDVRSLYYKLEESHSGCTGHGSHPPYQVQGNHNTFCVLNTFFRFGVRIDYTKHYDVSKDNDKKISNSAIFQNCHDEDESFKNKTHLNIFSNDFIRST